MIKPFVDKQNRKGKVSFGLSSYGYDARVSNEFKIFTNVNSGVLLIQKFLKRIVLLQKDQKNVLFLLILLL